MSLVETKTSIKEIISVETLNCQRQTLKKERSFSHVAGASGNTSNNIVIIIIIIIRSTFIARKLIENRKCALQQFIDK